MARVEGSITAGAVGLPVEITVDGQWDGLVRSLVCMSAAGRVVLAGVDDRAEVAWEVLVPGLHLYLGLEGRSADGSIVIPTTWADCGVIQPSPENSHTGKPTPGEVEQLLTLAGSARDTAFRAEQVAATAKAAAVGAQDSAAVSAAMAENAARACADSERTAGGCAAARCRASRWIRAGA